MVHSSDPNPYEAGFALGLRIVAVTRETAKQEPSPFSTIPDYHVGEKGSIWSFFVRTGRKLKKRCMVPPTPHLRVPIPIAEGCAPSAPSPGEGLPVPSQDLPAQSLPPW